MLKIFVVVFILVPLFELYVLIEVGSVIGALPTIFLTVATAILGAWLMRHQGLQVMQEAQLAMAKGEAPEQQVIEGVLIFLGGALLLLPGLVSDTLGLILLVPPLRAAFARAWLRRVAQQRAARSGVVEAEWQVKEAGAKHIEFKSTQDGKIIEGEWGEAPKK
ncbi:MAG: FxsA family protein [Thiomicrospira sp.]|jgi:UPF0716 protein FxsA|nr:FxsA family protein [Thiomicrospira sp.]